jgi:hypothetical protein
MMPSEQAILDDFLIQQPSCSISRARKLWARLGVFSRFVLVKGKVVVAAGGKLLPAGLEVIRRVILGIPWLVVCISMAMFVGSWYFAGPAVTVSSFIDASGDKSGSLGQMIADTLALELQRIDQLDTVKNPWGRAEEVHSLLVTTPQAYERVGTISVGGTQLPVGELLLALKGLLPHWYPQRVISGSIWRSSSGEGTPVRILVRLEENGRILKHWSSQEAPVTDDAAIQRFMTTVAFEIMWSMGKGSSANSVENFQSYINGVEKFRRYKDMRLEQDFHEAEMQLSAAIKNNPEYVKAHYYLGTLYSWRANYEETNTQLVEDYEQKAREQYNMIQVRVSPEEQALGHFGLGLLAYRHYGREKRLSSRQHDTISPSNLKLREADQHFKEAMRLQPKLNFARTGHALVYKEMGCIRLAIREFERARQKVEDKSSLLWIEKQIETLKEREQRAKQAMEKERAGKSRWPRLLAVFSWSSEQKGCA